MPADETELTNLACELSLLKHLKNKYLIDYVSAFALDANEEVPEPHLVPPAWRLLHRKTSAGSSGGFSGPNFGFVGIITSLVKRLSVFLFFHIVCINSIPLSLSMYIYLSSFSCEDDDIFISTHQHTSLFI